MPSCHIGARAMLLAALLAWGEAAQPQALTAPAVGYLHGLRPEVASGTVLWFHDGTATDALGNTQIAVTRFRDTHAYLQVDLSFVGLNGRDSPHALDDGHFDFYLLRSLSNNAVGIVASRAQTYGGVIPPAGGPWLMRKLPYGIPTAAISEA